MGPAAEEDCPQYGKQKASPKEEGVKDREGRIKGLRGSESEIRSRESVHFRTRGSMARASAESEAKRASS